MYLIDNILLLQAIILGLEPNPMKLFGVMTSKKGATTS
jgi:hypothetical protein